MKQSSYNEWLNNKSVDIIANLDVELSNMYRQASIMKEQNNSINVTDLAETFKQLSEILDYWATKINELNSNENSTTV